MKNILFAASECSPFVKTGGLADVVCALPKALVEHHRIQAQVILPLYDEIDEEWKEEMEFVTEFIVPLGWRVQMAELYHCVVDEIDYYFIHQPYYFHRKGVYGYYDDGERFVFFSRAIIEALPYLQAQPDLLHAHDWQAALSIALAKILLPEHPMKTILTIHNLKFQGKFPIEVYDDFLNLGSEHMSGMEWDGHINCLKAGIFHADQVTTVSPTYAEEIQNEYYGEGLDSLLRERQVMGIINGIDVKQYNPLQDPYIDVTYRSSRTRKVQNKLLLQEYFGFEVDENIPLYIIISRLDEQKGLHLLQPILNDFLQEKVQLICLGTGEKEFENFFRSTASEYREKMIACIGFDEQLSRKLYAAADFLIMPSRFEPCGLAQFIALQYKTVPIVRETGGLKDSIEPFNLHTKQGNGFSFKNYNAHDLLYTLKYSLSIFHDEENWSIISKNINRFHFTWKTSAAEYDELYKQLCTEKELAEVY